jgi:hypothetical protein
MPSSGSLSEMASFYKDISDVGIIIAIANEKKCAAEKITSKPLCCSGSPKRKVFIIFLSNYKIF